MADPQRFAERFALLLADSGMPRMPARVFATVLASEEARLTARDLGRLLGVSAAAISGATRYLIHVGLLVRDRAPGERRDHFRLVDDLWYELYGNRQALFQRYVDIMSEGLDDVGPDAAERLEESRAFFAYLRDEMPGLMERWRSERKSLTPADR